MKSKLREHIPDLIYLLTLLLAGLIFTSNLRTFLDIGLFDESRYLQRGIEMFAQFPNPEHGPFYSLWYHLLSLYYRDSIDLYYANYAAMTFLPSIALFVSLRAYKISAIISFLFSIAFLCIAGNFQTWPKVSHFAVIIILLGFSVTAFFSSNDKKLFVISATSLIVSYVRPEYFYASIILFLIVGTVAILKYKRTRLFTSFRLVLVNLVLLLIFYLGLGNPASSGNRDLVAFGQHYAKNWVRQNNDRRDPWTEWYEILQKDFGNVGKFSDVLKTNPAAVLRHALQNVDRLPGELKSFVRSFYPLSIAQSYGLKIMLLVLIVIGTLLYENELRKFLAGAVKNVKSNRFLTAIVLILISPSILSVLLIYPRRHYLLILIIIFSMLLIINLFQNVDLIKDSKQTGIAVACSLLTLILIRPLSASSNSNELRTLQMIECIRSLKVNSQISLLDANGHFSTFLGKNYKQIEEFSKYDPFNKFIDDNNINMIILSNPLRNHTRYKNDPEWQEFLTSPERLGFKELGMCRDNDYRVLLKDNVKSDMLQ